MSDSGPELTAAAEKEEEERLYRWLYDLPPYDLDEKFPYSPEHSPVHPESHTEMETLAAEPAETQGTNVSKNTTGMKHNTQSSEKKFWMKPGASISDYFNYGFDEQTWSAYCKKQARLQRFRRNTEIMAQRKQVGCGEEEPCCSYSSSGRASIPASRKPNAGHDVSRGRDGRSSTAEGPPRLSDGAKTMQVATEMTRKEDSTTTFSLLPLPVINESLFAYTPPPRFLFKSESPSPYSSAVLGSGHNQSSDGPSASLHKYFSASSPSVTDTTKGQERFSSHGKCDKDRNRSTAGDRHKESKRHREQQSSSSSHDRDERQLKKRKATEDRHKHPKSAAAGSMAGKTGKEDTNTSQKKKKAKKRQKKKRKSD